MGDDRRQELKYDSLPTNDDFWETPAIASPTPTELSRDQFRASLRSQRTPSSTLKDTVTEDTPAFGTVSQLKTDKSSPKAFGFFYTASQRSGEVDTTSQTPVTPCILGNLDHNSTPYETTTKAIPPPPHLAAVGCSVPALPRPSATLIALLENPLLPTTPAISDTDCKNALIAFVRGKATSRPPQALRRTTTKPPPVFKLPLPATSQVEETGPKLTLLRQDDIADVNNRHPSPTVNSDTIFKDSVLADLAPTEHDPRTARKSHTDLKPLFSPLSKNVPNTKPAAKPTITGKVLPVKNPQILPTARSTSRAKVDIMAQKLPEGSIARVEERTVVATSWIENVKNRIQNSGMVRAAKGKADNAIAEIKATVLSTADRALTHFSNFASTQINKVITHVNTVGNLFDIEPRKKVTYSYGMALALFAIGGATFGINAHQVNTASSRPTVSPEKPDTFATLATNNVRNSTSTALSIHTPIAIRPTHTRQTVSVRVDGGTPDSAVRYALHALGVQPTRALVNQATEACDTTGPALLTVSLDGGVNAARVICRPRSPSHTSSILAAQGPQKRKG